MFHFGSPINFVFLVLILAAVGLFWANSIGLAALRQKLATPALFARLAPAYNPHRRKLKFTLTAIAAACLIFSLANPRGGIRNQKIQRQSVDLYLALDISKSMLAQDISPNRLEKARQFGLKLLSSLRGERIGLITFAGDATMEVPLTVDYQAVEMLLQIASPEDMPTQGTAIEAAIELAMRSQAKEKKTKQKAIVFVTDGENHEEEAVQKAQSAAEKGIFTFIVGVGTTEGAKIPINRDTYAGFQLDKSGAVVVSKMNETLMQKIAAAGQGQFWDLNKLSSTAVISDLAGYLAGIEKNEFEQRAFDDYDTYFYWTAAIALLLLLVEMLIPNANKVKPFILPQKLSPKSEKETAISRKAQLLDLE